MKTTWATKEEIPEPLKPFLDSGDIVEFDGGFRLQSDDTTYWKGNNNWAAIAMELHHVVP